MNLGFLYTSTEGRIGRQQWWLGVIILGVIMVVINMIAFSVIGFGAVPNVADIQAGTVDNAALAAMSTSIITRTGWIALVLMLIFAYPYYALAVKRRHDRDNNGLDVIVFLVLVVIMDLLQALGLTYSPVDIGGTLMPMPNIIGTVLPIIVGIFALYLLVVMGFLKGTTGPNQYGPDPLGGRVVPRAA